MTQPEFELRLGEPSERHEIVRAPPWLSIVAEEKTRTLKIEATGDFWRRKIKPKIRLCGHWLEHAGFKPGHHVQVTVLKPGELTLQLVKEPQTEASKQA